VQVVTQCPGRAPLGAAIQSDARGRAMSRPRPFIASARGHRPLAHGLDAYAVAPAHRFNTESTTSVSMCWPPVCMEGS
jgi:hypothetical protein